MMDVGSRGSEPRCENQGELVELILGEGGEVNTRAVLLLREACHRGP